jgi:hypothetical protein
MDRGTIVISLRRSYMSDVCNRLILTESIQNGMCVNDLRVHGIHVHENFSGKPVTLETSSLTKFLRHVFRGRKLTIFGSLELVKP